MPNHANRSNSAPDVLVRYEQCLCHASIGEVWLGRLLNGNDAGRVVLLRRINKQWLSAKDAEWVLYGAEAYSKVRHPSLAKLLGVLEQGEDLVSISEHLEGVRLLELEHAVFTEGVPIPATVAVRLVLDAARAARNAHQLAADVGIFPTERLFLPEGVLVTSFGATLLTEVGVLSALAKCVMPRTLPQLLAQLAPEELGAKGEVVSSPEVFSLGVVLWELLANRWLFTRESDSRTHQELLLSPIPSLDEVERFGMPVPDPLVQLVKRAVARDPTQRFASLNELILAFERLPAHFIAAEHQVAEVLRQRVNSLLEASEGRPSFRARSGTFSEVRATQPSLPPPSASSHDWDRPTLAQSSLISGQIYVGSITPGATTSAPGTLGVPMHEPKPSRVAPKRKRLGAVLGILSIGVIVAFTVAFRVAPERLHFLSSPAPAAALTPARGDTARKPPGEIGALQPNRLDTAPPAASPSAADPTPATEPATAVPVAAAPSSALIRNSTSTAATTTKRSNATQRPSRKAKSGRGTKAGHESSDINVDAQWGI